MATITYRGVGGGGNLFAGKKFFFLQRVPSRLHYIELVQVRTLSRTTVHSLTLRQANGGEIVKLEKHADIVIADHARKKDCPPGSISWKYIEESAKKGELEDEEDHRAGPATHVPREVGSGQPTKKGRTPFTAEDDRVLTQWCHEAERKGLSLKGNEIYKQLEIKVRLEWAIDDWCIKLINCSEQPPSFPIVARSLVEISCWPSSSRTSKS